MTKTQMRSLARHIGILSLHKQSLDKEIKELKAILVDAVKTIPPVDGNNDTPTYILDKVEGFTAKLYGRVQLFADQKIARKLLHANTFNAIFKPTHSEIMDIRPTSETKCIAIELLLAELDMLRRRDDAA